MRDMRILYNTFDTEILELEKECFGNSSLTEKQLTNFRRKRNHVVRGLVRKDNDVMDGYMMYKRMPTALRLMRIGVRPELQRQRLGHVMLTHLRLKLSAEGEGPSKIITKVPDKWEWAHYFLRAECFQCIKVEGAEKNIYVFEYQYVGDCY